MTKPAIGCHLGLSALSGRLSNPVLTAEANRFLEIGPTLWLTRKRASFSLGETRCWKSRHCRHRPGVQIEPTVECVRLVGGSALNVMSVADAACSGWRQSSRPARWASHRKLKDWIHRAVKFVGKLVGEVKSNPIISAPIPGPSHRLLRSPDSGRLEKSPARRHL